jgi:hypothetical protein
MHLPSHNRHSKGKQKCRLNTRSHQWPDGHRLAQQRVGAEGERQDDGDDRKCAGVIDEIRHARSGQQKRRRLKSAQPLMQECHSQNHVDQWIHEISEARLKHMVVRDGPDEGEPVRADGQRARAEIQQLVSRSEAVAHIGPATLQRDGNQQEDDRPDDAMRQHIERWHMRNALEVKRDDAPRAVGEDAVDQAEAERCAVCRGMVPIVHEVLCCG